MLTSEGMACIFVIIALYTMTPAAGVRATENFVQFLNFKGKSDCSTTVVVSSLLHCSAECTASENCYGFSFKRSNQKCLHHCWSPSLRKKVAAGWAFYQLRLPECTDVATRKTYEELDLKDQMTGNFNDFELGRFKINKITWWTRDQAIVGIRTTYGVIDSTHPPDAEGDPGTVRYFNTTEFISGISLCWNNVLKVFTDINPMTSLDHASVDCDNVGTPEFLSSPGKVLRYISGYYGLTEGTQYNVLKHIVFHFC